MPNGTVTVRVAATGRGVFMDVIPHGGDNTVGGVLDTLARRGVEYNGQEVNMFLNGIPVTPEDPVNNLDSLTIVPDKPTGN